jgi:adenylosuccinate lyase
MLARYTHPQISEVWSEDYKLSLWIEIETLACMGWERLGVIPMGTSLPLMDIKVSSIDKERLASIEKEVKHEFLAFLTLINEMTPVEDNRHYHRGLTSSDVLDTAFSLQLRKAGGLILNEMQQLLDNLKAKAFEHKTTVMMGRTHGMYGEPTTFGLVMASHYMEWVRNYKRLISAIEEVCVGKLSGPMGNFTVIDPLVEAFVCERLGLKPEPVSTQVIPRDRHAVFFSTLGIIGSSIERLAVEIRNLQQSSVNEVSEAFSDGQKGSSAMPHKKNPISSENLSGIARLLRSYVMPSLEDIPLWHERDMSHSSVERVIAPDATHLAGYSIKRLADVIKGLNVHKDVMLKHVEEAGDSYKTQSYLVQLTDKGMSREEAYKRLQENNLEGLELEEVTLADILRNTNAIFKQVAGTWS